MPKKKFKFTKVSKKKTKKPKYSFEYVPEKIVDKKVSQSGETYYLARWANTWEDEDVVRGRDAWFQFLSEIEFSGVDQSKVPCIVGKWEILEIGDMKNQNGTVRYHVKWQDTWLSRHELYHCRKLIYTYERSVEKEHPEPTPKRRRIKNDSFVGADKSGADSSKSFAMEGNAKAKKPKASIGDTSGGDEAIAVDASTNQKINEDETLGEALLKNDAIKDRVGLD